MFGYYSNWYWGLIPKVLPTVYDDSLSYYEVLNKLIKAVGGLAEAIDDISPATIKQYAEQAQESAESASESAEQASEVAQELNEKIASTGSTLFMPFVSGTVTDLADSEATGLTLMLFENAFVAHAYVEVSMSTLDETLFTMPYKYTLAGQQFYRPTFKINTLCYQNPVTSGGVTTYEPHYLEVGVSQDHEGWTLRYVSDDDYYGLPFSGKVELWMFGTVEKIVQ